MQYLLELQSLNLEKTITSRYKPVKITQILPSLLVHCCIRIYFYENPLSTIKYKFPFS